MNAPQTSPSTLILDSLTPITDKSSVNDILFQEVCSWVLIDKSDYDEIGVKTASTYRCVARVHKIDVDEFELLSLSFRNARLGSENFELIRDSLVDEGTLFELPCVGSLDVGQTITLDLVCTLGYESRHDPFDGDYTEDVWAVIESYRTLKRTKRTLNRTLRKLHAIRESNYPRRFR